MTWESHLGFWKYSWKVCKSLVLRFKDFSPNLQRGITKQTRGKVVYCLTEKKKSNKTEKRKKNWNIHIQYKLTEVVHDMYFFHNVYGCAWTHVIQNHDSFTYKARPEKHLQSVQSHKSWMVCTWRSPASLALWLNLLQLNYYQQS